LLRVACHNLKFSFFVPNLDFGKIENKKHCVGFKSNLLIAESFGEPKNDKF